MGKVDSVDVAVESSKTIKPANSSYFLQSIKVANELTGPLVVKAQISAVGTVLKRRDKKTLLSDDRI